MGHDGTVFGDELGEGRPNLHRRTYCLNPDFGEKSLLSSFFLRFLGESKGVSTDKFSLTIPEMLRF